MKYLLFIGTFLCSVVSNAQILKFKAFKLQSVVKDRNNEFVSTSDWFTISSLVVIKVDDGKINIYNEKELSFDIVKVEDIYTDVLKDRWYVMTCIDKDGRKCRIRECTLNKVSNGDDFYRLYVDYLDVTYVYKMRNN